MSKFSYLKNISVLYLIVSLVLAVFTTFHFAKIRSVGYERIPTIGIFDERNYALQGISIRRNGIPIGWSDSGSYEKTTGNVQTTKLNGLQIEVNNQPPSFWSFGNFPKPVLSVNEFDFGLGKQHLKLVQPFLDHTPIGGLVYSLGLGDTRGFLDITPDQFRKPALYLGILTSLLLFTFIYQMTGSPGTSLLSTILYNSVPTYLLASRYALLENVLAPFVLIHLNFLLLSKRLVANKRWSLFLLLLSGLFAGISVLAKETGAGFVLGSLGLLILWKYPKKSILLFVISAALIVGLYIIWGMWLSSQLFLEVFLFNAGRGSFGSLNFLYMLPSLRFPQFPFDGWWIWGFISILILALKDWRSYAPLLLPISGHLLILTITSHANYPWYYLAFIPFLAASSAGVIWNMIKQPSLIVAVAFFLIPLSSSFYWGYTVFHLPPTMTFFRLLFLAFFGILTLKLVYPKLKLISFGWILFWVILIFEITKWNQHSIFFIIENWNHLPFPSLPTM